MRNKTEKNGTETEDANCGIKKHPLLMTVPKRLSYKKRKNKEISGGRKVTKRDVIAIRRMPKCWIIKHWHRKWVKARKMSHQGVWNIINNKTYKGVS